ncbi:PAS domain S-box protein, partial [Streptomyces bacillaris]
EEQGAPEPVPAQQGEGSGRRRGRPSPAEAGAVGAGAAENEAAGSGPAGGGRGGSGGGPPAIGAAPGGPVAGGAAEGERGAAALQQAQAQAPQPQRQALALTSSAPSEGSVVTAAEGAQGAGRPQRGQTVPPQGVPADPQQPVPPAGRRARREDGDHRPALPALAAGSGGSGVGAGQGQEQAPGAQGVQGGANPSPADAHAQAQAQQSGGRRARRALAAAQERTAAEAGPRTAFALPPAEADRAPAAQGPAPVQAPGTAPVPPPGDDSHHERTAPEAGHTPPQAHPVAPHAPHHADRPVDGVPQAGTADATPVPAPAPGPAPAAARDDQQSWGAGVPQAPAPVPGAAPHGSRPTADDRSWGGNGQTTHTTGTAAAGPAPHPADAGAGAPVPDARRQPLPAEEPAPGINPDSTQGRAFSVRTLGQGVPFAQHLPQQGQSAPQPNQPAQPAASQPSLGGAGRRRKLAAPPEGERSSAQPTVPAPDPGAAAQGGPGQQPAPAPQEAQAAQAAVPGSGQLLAPPVSEGRAYAIGAPDEGAEGPEPLDGPGGAVEVANRPQPQPLDDELPPEPLDNPRRLLVWPAPDVPTQQALSDRGYRPVIVNSREEVDAQIAAFPAALFVDPLTGPITRKALQSLRQAAVAAEVPVLVTAGLGQASREAAYGADPAVLLKALAPRDSEQHPPRVLLIEEHAEIAAALEQTLERRQMQVARAATDSEAVDLAGRMRPNLVVMDLMQVRRRRAGIIDWLRANGQLNRTPLVVYTSAEMDPSELPRLASGETVLFLAERSTSDEVQSRIVDLLAKIGTN